MMTIYNIRQGLTLSIVRPLIVLLAVKATTATADAASTTVQKVFPLNVLVLRGRLEIGGGGW